MSDDEIILTNANDNVLDNMIQPFSFDRSAIRGRVVRLGSVLQEILTPHDYPSAIAGLVAEGAALTLLLGGMLKYEGIFTLQAQGDGPVRMLVCDLTSGGDLRAVAHYDRVEAQKNPVLAPGSTVTTLRPSDKALFLPALMGKGHLAFTVDQGTHTDRYQGIVSLDGNHLADCVQHYFEQSEQIGTVIKVAAGEENGVWRAGGMMIQKLPLPDDQKTPEGIAAAADDWDRARALLSTCTHEELISETLIAPDLLYRLFHEEEVRAYNPLHLKKGCRCTTEKLSGILKTLSSEELSHMAVDGKITMTCEFCNKDFVFDPAKI